MELLGRSRSLCNWVLVLVTLLVNHKVLFGCEGCLEQERSTLIKIRDSVNHPDGHGLTWGLFAYLEKLSSLTLDGNQISRWDFQPGCPQFESLQSLSLENNFLNESKPDLSCLRLQENKFSTSLAIQGLCKLPKIQVLDLHSNQLLDGSIPPCLTNLTQLTHLDLSNNRFGDQFPLNVLRDLNSLEHVDLSNSQLSVVFPFSIWANHVNLSFIDLSSNHQLKVETEFPPWVPSFQLRHLKLSNCSLNSKIGAIPKFLATQNNLEMVDLSSTKLRGSIPSWLFGNSSYREYVDLSHNLLSGGFPIPSSPLAIRGIYLSYNNISGPLPPNISALFPYLVNFSMSNNAIEGNILPNHFGDMASLSLLDLSNNKLTGDVSFTQFIEYPSLKTLKLANNRLHGSPGIYIASSLRVLDISENFFYGSIKAWIVSLPNLEVLIMHNNRLEGSIPNETCDMPNLRILDLSHNNLSGLIPECFIHIDPWTESDMERKKSSLDGVVVDLTTKGRTYSFSRAPLSKMTSIDLSKNALNGVIPPQMGFLQGLHSLNLSYNYLRDGIPTTFQQLHELESLDLSHNQLNGSIPLELEKLDRLTVLSLSFNNFSGKM
ncbi:LRR receptor-like serine/threonine-protein kinase GSO1 [Cinnamomum micranthum f. kanehirae]|uniref:LRR receptor-like serine/threonine-protein kinase GSO1 n=1 Tax=Cinnamomum micranthum f. kanehirae TaxID=337451 RepID=A0A3S3NUR0_9MAGN|nr:LRR receptor-like serine/threonine-protein kinase GSO1 [Cinnamomum micranthum f. kanehirae]